METIMCASLGETTESVPRRGAVRASMHTLKQLKALVSLKAARAKMVSKGPHPIHQGAAKVATDAAQVPRHPEATQFMTRTCYATIS